MFTVPLGIVSGPLGIVSGPLGMGSAGYGHKVVAALLLLRSSRFAPPDKLTHPFLTIGSAGPDD